MKNIKFFEDFESSDELNLSSDLHEGDDGEMDNYMFFQNLNTLKGAIEDLLGMDREKVDEILSDGHGWALDHIATSTDDVEEVYHFLSNRIEHDHSDSHDDDDDDDDYDDNEESPISVRIEGSDDNVEIETGDEDE